ncbi:MAG TPA: hypothetical protein DD379_03450 [Cyanobacteria bacterium UBA11162]|nr:hypothetical protein [Cyanobacteria bacterium UBA11162]
MVQTSDKTLWELLWEYDPNGLIVVDHSMKITLVNPAFCRMFQVDRETIIGQEASLILEDVEDFQAVWENDQVIRGKEEAYEHHNLYVRKVIFPIKEENIIACIMVDMTHEFQRKQEMIKLKAETVSKVNEVVDNQMKVVQEIAGLLGETTAQTKVSLLKIIQMVEQEMV